MSHGGSAPTCSKGEKGMARALSPYQHVRCAMNGVTALLRSWVPAIHLPHPPPAHHTPHSLTPQLPCDRFGSRDGSFPYHRML
eukprot:6024362-Pyramimonas_sp.AAC.1